MQVRLLGPIDIIDDDGRTVVLSAAKQRATLALLALSANEPVTVDRMIDALWPDDVPSSAKNLVQGYVGKVRHAVGPDRIEHRGGAYTLRLGPDELDVFVVERQRDRGRADEALSVWRGRAIEEFESEAWALTSAQRLEQLRVALRQAAAAAAIRDGRAQDAVADLEPLVAEHPLDEHLYAMLMRAQYAAGRQADALRTFQRAREVLVGELGVEPGPELRALEGAILRQDADLDAPAPLVADGAGSVVSAPVPLTPTIGREGELERLTNVLRSNRLVSVVGPGGVGKTRLVLELCRRGGRTGDAAFVDLAPVGAPDVAATVGAALGLAERADMSWIEALDTYLRDVSVLLVLDNAEHVRAAVRELVTGLLSTCPDVGVLVTSREAVGVSGEAIVRLEGLEPDHALSLFWDRAPHRQTGTRDDDLARAIVDRLDCLPLAIELAAAQLDVLTAAQLRDRLDDQLAVLVGTAGTAADRHGTMRATIAWGHRLLDARERRALAALAVFAGPFTLAAAEAVVERDGGELVARLLRKSMVARGPDVDGRASYRLLEPIRQFASGETPSNERDEAVGRLDGYLSVLAADAAVGVRTAEAPRWMVEVRFHLQDVRASVERGLSTGSPRAGTMIADLYWPWFLEGRLSELTDWTMRALAEPSDDPREAARLWWARSAALIALGDLVGSDAAATAQLDAARRADDPELEGLAHSLRGMVAWAQGDHTRAMPEHRRAVERTRASGMAWTIALVGALAGRSALALGETDEGHRLLSDAIAVASELGEPMVLGSALDYRAAAVFERGDHRTARTLADQSLDAYRRIGYREGVASALSLLGTISIVEGDIDRADDVFVESLGLSRQLQHVGGTAFALEGLAHAAHGRGDDDTCRHLLLQADELRVRSGIPVPSHTRDATNELRHVVLGGDG